MSNKLKFCEDCKHRRCVAGSMFKTIYCYHAKIIRRDPSTGEVSLNQMTCYDCRENDCGKDAKLFEPRKNHHTK